MSEQEEESIFDFINGLEISLPDKGLVAPDLESIEDDTEELEGNVITITFDLNLFLNHRQDRYFMLSSNQKMQNLGKMSLKDAIAKFNNNKPRRKRK